MLERQSSLTLYLVLVTLFTFSCNKMLTRENSLGYKPVYFIVLCLVVQGKKKGYRSVIVAICCI